MSSSTTSCGLSWLGYPKYLQRFATTRSFILVYGILGIFQAMGYIYFIITLQTMEKRFKIPSQTTGLILSGNELSQILLSVILAYFGGQRNRPRFIAWGVIFCSLSCFILALPHFIYGPGEDALRLTKEFMESSNSTILDNSAVDKHFRESNRLCLEGPMEHECNDEIESILPLVLIFLSQFVLGIGNTLYYALGQTYLDDNTKKTNTPLLLSYAFSLRTLGPAIGFVLAYGSLKMYIDPSKTPLIDSQDPRWFPSAMKRLFKNKLLMSNILSGIFYILGASAYFTFMSKYLEVQFHKSAADATIITGPLTIIGVVCGFLASGYVISKKKPKPSKLLMWNVIVGVLYMGGQISNLYFACPDGQTPMQIQNGKLNLSSTCNMDCHCTGIAYTPVCYEPTGDTFFNPCVAGCNQYSEDEKFYHECECLRNLQRTTRSPTTSTTLSLIHSSTLDVLTTRTSSLLTTESLTEETTRQSSSSTTPSFTQTQTNNISDLIVLAKQEMKQDFQDEVEMINVETEDRKELKDEVKNIEDEEEDYDDYAIEEENLVKESKYREKREEPEDIWGKLVPGACVKGCAFGFYAFSIVSSIINCFGASGRIGNLLVNYRCVSNQDKSVTQGLILMLVSLFALIPGPIMFGRIIDQTCLVWTEQCSGRRGNCQLYDQRLFRYYINLTALALTSIGVFFDILVWKYGKNLDLYGEREQEMLQRKQKEARNGRNQLWNEIIGTNALTMRRLPLIIQNWELNCNDILQINRNVHTIIVENSEVDDALTQSIINNSYYVQHFLIMNMLMMRNELTKIFNSLKKCEKLTVLGNIVADNSHTVTDPIHGPKMLKLLSLKFCDYGIVEFLIDSKVQVRNLILEEDKFYENEMKDLKCFLTLQTCLESLAISYFNTNVIKMIVNNNTQCPLKKLIAIWPYSQRTNAEENYFFILLNKHRSTIEELEIVNLMNDDILHLIFNELKLKKLSIGFENLDHFIFNEIIRRNSNLTIFSEHVKSLVVSPEMSINNNLKVLAIKRFSHISYIEDLVQYLPALEEFILWSQENLKDILKAVANNCKRLRYLEIGFYDSSLSVLQFPNLQTFCVQRSENLDVMSWKSFLINNPSIENVHLGRIFQKDLLKKMTLKIPGSLITRPLTFKCLKLFMYFKLTTKRLDMISEAFPNLKELDIFHKITKLEIYSRINSPNIKLTYHEWTYSKRFSNKEATLELSTF
ncbi:CLUMA_CG000186, isoform A [Clunio marinus]|uniref:CLUMA_CG000186, isoform A n=1 Tax=Clunio marinus TaxID=568069 RepID=A0A1J1HEP7_9DIPT|nr:CLUMA_CG000186, isoform A [Clunio marinus]